MEKQSRYPASEKHPWHELEFHFDRITSIDSKLLRKIEHISSSLQVIDYMVPDIYTINYRHEYVLFLRM